MSMRGSRGLLVAGAVALALSAGALVVSNPNPDAFDTPQPRGHDGQRPSGQAKIEEHDQRTVEAVAHRASRALEMAWGWGSTPPAVTWTASVQVLQPVGRPCASSGSNLRQQRRDRITIQLMAMVPLYSVDHAHR